MRKGEILYRKLGRTNEWVSAFGVGGYHIGSMKEEKETIKLIRTAIDKGLDVHGQLLGLPRRQERTGGWATR